MILTFSSIGGGIIRVAFFPRIASDQVSIELNMPNGTNEMVTDSIISLIEEKAKEVTKDIHNQYLGEDAEEYLVENMITTLGPGSAAARLQINLLPGEKRPNEINTGLVTVKSLQDKDFGQKELSFEGFVELMNEYK